MSGPDVSGQLARIEGLSDRLRRRHGLAASGVLLGAVVLSALLLAWAPPGWRSGPGSALPLLAWGIPALVLAGLLLGARRRSRDDGRLVREVESAAGLRPGELQGARELGTPPRGSSPGLARRHRLQVATALDGRSDEELLPGRLPRARARLRSGLAVAATTVALLAATAVVRPTPAREAVEALARPWRVAFPPRPPRLRIEAPATVLRGTPAPVRVRAPGRSVVTLAWAAEGVPVRRAGVAVDPRDGTAEGLTAPVEAPMRVWSEEAGRTSDTAIVSPVDPLLVTRLVVVVEPPDWTGLDPDTVTAAGAPLLVHPGSRLRISGEATHPLAAGWLVPGTEEGADGERAGGRTPLEVDGPRFAGDLRPERDGAWRFDLRPDGPVPGVRPPPPLAVRLREDRVPEVRVLRPGRDLEAGLDPELPLLVDASDDGGVVRVDLVTWRSTAAGLRSEPDRRVLVAGGAETRRLVRASLPIAGLDLAPGDTLHYRAEALDANPGRPPGRSREWRVWVPLLADLRRDAGRRVEEIAAEVATAAGESRVLSREARDAERLAAGRARAATAGTGSAGADYRSTEAARAVRERGRELERTLSELEERVARFTRALDESPVAEPSLRARLEEMAARLEELRASPLGERLRALEEAIGRLDRDGTRSALAEVAREASELERRIEEAAELFERAASEQAARQAAARAEELATAQEEAVASLPGPDPAWAEGEAALAARAEELAREMEAVSERLGEAGAERQGEEFGSASEDVGEAARAMREAAERAEGDGAGRPRDETSARGAAREAADALRAAARVADEASRALSRDWREEAVSALEGAARQSLDLAAEQARLAEDLASGRSGADPAGRQAAVRSGLDRVTRELSRASRRTALVDGRVGPAADRARRDMQNLERQLAAGGDPSGGASRSRELAERLNDLAGRLLASRREMQGASGATGLEEALERLARLGGAQADLARESGGLLLPSMRGEVDAERLARLAAMQERIARELESLADEGGSEGLAARPELLAGEAEEIARSIRDSGLDPETVARQERLFRRLLDAGRTLERDPDPGRRESRAAIAAGRSPTVPVGAEPRAGPRYPYPDEERLRDFSGQTRRLVLEYFDRLNRSAGGSP